MILLVMLSSCSCPRWVLATVDLWMAPRYPMVSLGLVLFVSRFEISSSQQGMTSMLMPNAPLTAMVAFLITLSYADGSHLNTCLVVSISAAHRGQREVLEYTFSSGLRRAR